MTSPRQSVRPRTPAEWEHSEHCLCGDFRSHMSEPYPSLTAEDRVRIKCFVAVVAASLILAVLSGK